MKISSPSIGCPYSGGWGSFCLFVFLSYRLFVLSSFCLFVSPPSLDAHALAGGRLFVFLSVFFVSLCLFVLLSFRLFPLRWTSLLWRVGALRTPVWNLRPVVGNPQPVNLSVTLSGGNWGELIDIDLEKIEQKLRKVEIGKFVRLLAILKKVSLTRQTDVPNVLKSEYVHEIYT